MLEYAEKDIKINVNKMFVDRGYYAKEKIT